MPSETSMSRKELTQLFISAPINPFVEMFCRRLKDDPSKQDYHLYLYQILSRSTVPNYDEEIFTVQQFINDEHLKTIDFINNTEWPSGTPGERLATYAEFVYCLEQIFKSLLEWHGYLYYPMN